MSEEGILIALLKSGIGPGLGRITAWEYSDGDLCDMKVRLHRKDWERVRNARRENEWADAFLARVHAGTERVLVLPELPGVFAPGRRVRILYDPKNEHMEGREGAVREALDGGVRRDSVGHIAIQVDGLYTVYYPPEDLEVL